MRKTLLMLMFLPLFITAQNKFGFYSHKEVLNAIPEYLQAVEEFELLKQRCNAEIEHNEQELTRKYVAFLDGQQEFPEPILRKRQKELQVMVDNSVLFRDRMKVWLSQAKDSLFAPHNETVALALAKVCERMDLAYVVDFDEVRYRYVNPKFAEEVTALVIEEVLNPSEESVPAVVECAENEEPVEENTVTEGDVADVIDEAVDTIAESSVTTATGIVATDTIKVATDNIQVVTDIIE